MRPKSEKKLLIITVKLHFAAEKSTISKYVKSVLSKAGIDISMFKAHSVRGASTSKLFQLNVPIDQIMKKAMWSSESTFRCFFNKEVLPTEDISHGGSLNKEETKCYC